MLKGKMVFGKMTEAQRKWVSYTQEELDKKRKRTNESGAFWFLGIFALIGAVANQTFLGILYEDAVGKQLLITAGLFLFCVVSCIFAVIIIRKPATSLAEDISRVGENGCYTPEEVCDFYREVRENPNNLIFLFDSDRINESNHYSAGVFTDNWMKIHGNEPFVKYSDIVAAWHNIDRDGTEFTGFHLLRIDGEQTVTKCTQEFSDRILEEIGRRNPLTILARNFTYEGKHYDVIAQKNEVIDIYKSSLDSFLKQAGKMR